MTISTVAKNGKKKIGRPPAPAPRGKFLYSTTQARLDWIEKEAAATGTSKASIIDWAIDQLIEGLGYDAEKQSS